MAREKWNRPPEFVDPKDAEKKAKREEAKVAAIAEKEREVQDDHDFLPTQRQIYCKQKFWESKRNGFISQNLSDIDLEKMTGIPHTTVSRWKRKPGFLLWLQDSFDIDGLAKGYAELALKTLANQLESGNAKVRNEAAKALLAYQKQERRHITVDDISEKSEEELDREFETLRKVVPFDD
jgi:hypothetical protein